MAPTGQQPILHRGSARDRASGGARRRDRLRFRFGAIYFAVHPQDSYFPRILKSQDGKMKVIFNLRDKHTDYGYECQHKRPLPFVVDAWGPIERLKAGARQQIGCPRGEPNGRFVTLRSDARRSFLYRSPGG